MVYRGKHFPICKSYLAELNGLLDDFVAIDVDILAVSADPEEKAKASASDIGYNGTIGYDLSISEISELGVYISDPRSHQETDRPSAEPATFVVRDDGKLQIVDIKRALLPSLLARSARRSGVHSSKQLSGARDSVAQNS